MRIVVKHIGQIYNRAGWPCSIRITATKAKNKPKMTSNRSPNFINFGPHYRCLSIALPTSHLYPLTYSATLTAVLYHAFITLFLDYKGDYERNCRKYLPLILLALSFLLSVICASSGFYSQARTSSSPVRSDARQFCDLAVPGIVGESTVEVAEISRVTYRLVYEIVLPYMIPLVLVAFPYVSLLVGRNLTSHYYNGS